MAFRFKRKESLSNAVRRIGLERVEDVLESLKDFPQAEAIHSARKDIKKLRALLRLVRTELEGKEFRQVARLLREAAKLLAGPRDALIKVKTLRSVESYFKVQLAPQALRWIRLELRKGFETEMTRFAREKNKKAAERVLRSTAKELESIDVKGKGWKVMGPGLKAAYSQGKRAYQVALKDASPDDFHDWRKRAKDLWCHVLLLRRVWPEQMDAVAEELETLGENLGDHHDLEMLRQSIQELCDGDPTARELETLCGLIEQRQLELQSAALPMGARFYAEKPSGFCKRLAGYWKIWRKEKKSVGRPSNQLHNL